MTKARSRSTAKKVKDKWKSKGWYQILAPTLFDKIPVAEALADKPASLVGRITELSLQDITNDFRKSHIKLFFKVYKVEESVAHTQLEGHTLTSDYVRRMIRRRKSRIDGVFDITTRDNAFLRVKPFATTEKRIQSSQKKMIREVMKKTIADEGKAKTLNEFIRDALDGKIGSEIYKNCKHLYPVKRIEIAKTDIMRQPTIEIEETKPVAKQEQPEEKTKETEVPSAPVVSEKPVEETETKEPETEVPEEKASEVAEEKVEEETEEIPTKKDAEKPVKKKTAKTKEKKEKKPSKPKTKKKTEE